MPELSIAAKTLWAKKSKSDYMLWLPLVMHMSDSAWMARKLWRRWLPQSLKDLLTENIGEESEAEKLLMFLGAVHDLGKATPLFQAKTSFLRNDDLDNRIYEKLKLAGVDLPLYRKFSNNAVSPHALATQLILEKAGCNVNIASILGAHHGKPQNIQMLQNNTMETFPENYYYKDKHFWEVIHEELIGFSLQLAGFENLNILPKANLGQQVILSALVIMIDWLVSNENYFPNMSLEEKANTDVSKTRVENAWNSLNFAYPWQASNEYFGKDIFKERFGEDFKARAVQESLIELAKKIDKPGILVLEAPMGVGKTEAALACAEIFANKSKCSGIFFALPTQATSDGIFPRLIDWLKYLLQDNEKHSIRLAHGKAQFNEQYQELKNFSGSINIDEDIDTNISVNSWFEGQKQSLLADFVVGTIDQLLMAALKQKHCMLRHLGLAGKVVIIDECHAYDAYMSKYLMRILNWLGAYQVPVIVLSATLPALKRQSVIEAYLGCSFTPAIQDDPLGLSVEANEQKKLPSWCTSREYPLVTYTDGKGVLQSLLPMEKINKEVEIRYCDDSELIDKLKELLSDGGCAGIIVNTVKRSQEIADRLRQVFGIEIIKLFHSRFLAPERIKKEQELMSLLGKPARDSKRPYKIIVVGTQVLEQSLDIDFDILFTDLCPMDLLLQRTGRLQRHQRNRPLNFAKAKCFVIKTNEENFGKANEVIYGKYLLMRTNALLPKVLKLPKSISELVQDTYDDNVPISHEPDGYQEAKEQWNSILDNKEQKASTFLLNRYPEKDQRKTMVDWLYTSYDTSEKYGEAAVRDTDESIEVLLIRKKVETGYSLLWQDTEIELDQLKLPDKETAQLLARQRIRLPGVLCSKWMIKDTIEQLESNNQLLLQEWQKSPWLNGELFLILDEKYEAYLNGYCLAYNKDDGLIYKKESDKGD
ncbi:MAG: CRISPR-associated helicase Cas3' [Negativicutes bacterium]|nr:CRISPR-associated helicase Cas3' [Negativicutes bacterium]